MNKIYQYLINNKISFYHGDINASSDEKTFVSTIPNLPSLAIADYNYISDTTEADAYINDKKALILNNLKTNMLPANKTFTFNNGQCEPKFLYVPIETKLVSVVITTTDLVEDLLYVNLIITISMLGLSVEHYPYNVPKIANHANGQIHSLLLPNTFIVPKGSCVSITCNRIEPKFYVDLYGYAKNYSE